MKSMPVKVVLLVCCLLLSYSCQSRKEGTIEGTVAPPCPGVHIVVSRSGKTVCAVDANTRDGKFMIALSPGEYDVSVSAPALPFPVSLAGIIVYPGKASMLPPLQIAQRSGAAALTGTVLPGGARTKVILLYEGKERASANASADGRYEFTALPAGNYALQASSLGYASDMVDIRLSGAHTAVQNMRLLYISSIDGVDWPQGVIRAKGRGIYPPNSTNRTAMHEMAKRAALSEAERNLLRIVEQIKLDPNHDLQSIMTVSAFTVKIKGFLQGFKIVHERELENGVEVELELPLTGPSGLTRYLAD